MRYAFYPGCSLAGTAIEYGLSVQDVCRRLDIQLDEVPGWTCCGASSGHATDRALSVTLPARNLALAQPMGTDVAVACPACYVRLRGAAHEVRQDARLWEQVDDTVGTPAWANMKVTHLLDMVCNAVGLDDVRRRVTRPLTGLRLVAYYGCYLVRPRDVAGFDDPENPQTLDSLLGVLGADVRDWSGKVGCCGGSLSLVKRDTVRRLADSLARAAREVDAEAIVTACPLCQVNLDTRQSTLPVLYFTELIGLAMGADGVKSWLRRHIINPAPLLSGLGLL